MITSYEVGAVLKVVDNASPALRSMAIAAREFDAIIVKLKESLGAISSQRFAGLIGRIGEISKQLDGTSVSAETSAKAIGGIFASVDTAAATSLGSVKALKTELASLGKPAAGGTLGGAAMRTIHLPPGGGGGSGGGRPGSGGWHLGRVGAGPHGLTSPHMSMPGTPWLAAGAAVGYGAYLDAEMEDAIFQIEYHTGQKDTPETNAKFRKIIQDTMSKTGSSLSSVVEATKQEVRMFNGTPGGGVDVLPEMLMAAATEAKLKGTSLEESMTALIGLAHMTKEYTPEQIKKLAPAFAFLSAANPASLGSIERAASYSVPILQSGMDIDPLQTLLLGTALTRAGATNTKSGTWLRNMALNSMPGTSLMSKLAFEKHEGALKELGLVDEKNNPTWFTDGKPDLIKMLKIAGDHAAEIPLTKRAAYEKQLFGTQGAGGFALLADPAVRQQVASLGAEMNSPEFKARYGNFMTDYSAASPLQQGRQVSADAQNALMDLGKTIMPALTLSIQALDLQIKNWTVVFQSLGTATETAAAALYRLGGAIGGIISGALGTVKNVFGGPPAAALPPLNHQPMHPATSVNPHSVTGQHADVGTTIHSKTVVMLDGRVLGEAMSSQMASASTFPRQAAYNDTYVGWNAPDNNFSMA